MDDGKKEIGPPKPLNPPLPIQQPRQTFMITLKFFSFLCEAVGCDRLEWEFTEGLTVGKILEELTEEYPKVADATEIVASRNMSQAMMEDRVRNGDTIVFVPPVAGG